MCGGGGEGEYEWRMGGERRVESTAGRRNGDCGYCYGCYGCYAARQGDEKYRISTALYRDVGDHLII